MEIVVYQNLSKITDKIPFRLMHIRNRDEKGHIQPTGGATILSIINPYTKQVNVFSVRCSMKDKFNRKRGRELCLRKAVGKLYNKPIRNSVTGFNVEIEL